LHLAARHLHRAYLVNSIHFRLKSGVQLLVRRTPCHGASWIAAYSRSAVAQTDPLIQDTEILCQFRRQFCFPPARPPKVVPPANPPKAQTGLGLLNSASAARVQYPGVDRGRTKPGETDAYWETIRAGPQERCAERMRGDRQAHSCTAPMAEVVIIAFAA
jgi:hypothetical protein